MGQNSGPGSKFYVFGSTTLEISLLSHIDIKHNKQYGIKRYCLPAYFLDWSVGNTVQYYTIIFFKIRLTELTSTKQFWIMFVRYRLALPLNPLFITSPCFIFKNIFGSTGTSPVLPSRDSRFSHIKHQHNASCDRCI